MVTHTDQCTPRIPDRRFFVVFSSLEGAAGSPPLVYIGCTEDSRPSRGKCRPRTKRVDFVQHIAHSYGRPNVGVQRTEVWILVGRIGSSFIGRHQRMAGGH